MDIQTYSDEIDKINQEATDKIRLLKKKYALDNNPIRIGDLITDGFSTIKVEKIFVYQHSNPPCCVYRGPQLNKNKTVKKNGKTADIYQTNLVSKV